ncbi:MAG TPA: hypothetical protein VFS42_04065 [Burkholderiaceae bacterium]|nr:hypothetical protein [Burkholderiaceae bacterium]
MTRMLVDTRLNDGDRSHELASPHGRDETYLTASGRVGDSTPGYLWTTRGPPSPSRDAV